MFKQRCFYLFVALALLVAAAPLFAAHWSGRIVGNIINLFILLAATTAVARSHVAFVLSSLLAASIVVVLALAFAWGDAPLLPVVWILNGAFYLVTMGYLLRYVLQPSILDMDKLYGAAAVYLMMGVLWGYIYALIQHFIPGAFSVAGHPSSYPPVDLLYYSFTVLTTVGFGDVLPVLPAARSATILQQVSGVLYVAILIARLTGAYTTDRTDRQTGGDG